MVDRFISADSIQGLTNASLPAARPRYAGSQRRKDGVPLFDDPTLPPGWYRKVTERKTGATAGGWDTYITSSPQYGSKRFR